MSAGRDVERLISAWLTDEASDRSRDRVLGAVREAVNRMPQRRFRAAWREPMYLSPLRLAGMAAVFAIAVVGAALVGRATAPAGPGSPPTASPSPSAGQATLEGYRAAYNAICTRYAAQLNPLKDSFNGLYDESLSDEERAMRASVLAGYVTTSEAMADELGALVPPADLATEHQAMVQETRVVNGMIHDILDKLEAGDLVGAQSIDASTNSHSRVVEMFEGRYELRHCP